MPKDKSKTDEQKLKKQRDTKKKRIDNREEDAIIHTIEELSVWLQQLKVFLAHREGYEREWAVAKLFGRCLAKLYRRIYLKMQKEGRQPYGVHPQFPLPPYDFDQNPSPKGVKRQVDKIQKDLKKDKKKSK